MHESLLTADYHVHTDFSDDSRAPMDAVVRRALELGLDEICFTEHVDHGIKTVTNCCYPAYFQELERMRERYGDRIVIRAGIEFGVQLETAPQYREDFRCWPFDFVILSNHQVGGKEFWNGRFQEGKTQEQFHTAYYEAILQVMEGFQDYSILGHLDMIKRYDPHGPYPDGKILPIVEEILRRAIRAQVVLELENKLAREIITGYEDVAVAADPEDPTRCLVEFAFTVAHGLNQIWLTAHITV